MNKLNYSTFKAFRLLAGRLFIFGLAAAVSGAAHAGLYKWTDSQGKIHYSDQPPSTDARSIGRSAPGTSAITRDAQQSLDEKDAAYQQRRKSADEARAKADAESEQARIKRDNCEKARNNLATLQNSARVYTTDSTGQRRYMDDASRTGAMASSQKAVQENCR